MYMLLNLVTQMSPWTENESKFPPFSENQAGGDRSNFGQSICVQPTSIILSSTVESLCGLRAAVLSTVPVMVKNVFKPANTRWSIARRRWWIVCCVKIRGGKVS